MHFSTPPTNGHFFFPPPVAVGREHLHAAQRKHDTRNGLKIPLQYSQMATSHLFFFFHQPAVREGRPADVQMQLSPCAGDPGSQNAPILHRESSFCGTQTPPPSLPPPRSLLLCYALAPWYVHLTGYICNFAAAVV